MSDELELGGGEGGGQTVLSRLIEDEMRESFIDYSMSVIVQRALPDVRDGLKPVHRRILYAMSEAGLSPGRAYKKSATVVGDVLGKYHPHGDSAVYDSMVRMVQDFSLRYPLVDGQGNFGSVDGDSAAAYRYTEARLMALATELLADIDKNTVNYADNFDGSRQEPTVLPARVPNLLINGSSGIAVGMATNIPPHNLREIVQATTELIDDPDLPQERLEEIVQGPDFPTGGFVCGREGIRDAYRTGRGRVVMRAKAEIEQIDANSERIVVTEIPFMVNKSRLIEQIAQLVRDKKLPDIRDLRDESDRDGMRIVIELKRDSVPEIVLNRLYKHTQMQSTFGTIMLALVNGEPKVMPLREMLQHFIDHRLVVIVRRSEYDLEKALDREHILEGLKIAVDNIDEVIKIIRGSSDTETASQQLQESFDLSERQAKAILDMRLARLTGLEIEKLEEELEEVRAQIAELRRILGSEEVRMGILKDELQEVSDKYGDDRRTQITHAVGAFDVEDLIVEEDMVVTVSHQGYVKRLPVDTYRAQRRGGRGLRGMDTKDEDWVEHLYVASTHDYLMIFTRRGQCYWKKVWEIPVGSRISRGKPIVNLLNLEADEQIAAVVPVREFSEDRNLIFGTKNGVVKKTQLSAYGNVRTVGLNAINIGDDDELIEVRITSGEDEVFMASRSGMAIRFKESDARPMGRATAGVRGIKLREGDECVGMVVAHEGQTILAVSEKGMGKRTEIDEYRLQKRGGFGVINLKVSEKTGEVVAIRAVSEDEQLMMITKKGVVNRQRVEEIRVIGRATQGVRLMNLDKGDEVMDVARVIIDDEDDVEFDGELAAGASDGEGGEVDVEAASESEADGPGGGDDTDGSDDSDSEEE
ncbi:MAG: DNA gyrase subunit A [Gemmatimonadetes bacterium]|nr:DNA gyrase subunit A [Gemmatimonadota bacterium]NNL31556.1 DNA gyrase subunit A [Gemmatimonadota bacterium]